jgi:hypothetical protein
MSVALQMALFGKIILLPNVSHTTLHISPCLKIFDLGNASYCLRNNEDILITSDGSWSLAVSFSIPVYFPFSDFPLFHLSFCWSFKFCVIMIRNSLTDLRVFSSDIWVESFKISSPYYVVIECKDGTDWRRVEMWSYAYKPTPNRKCWKGRSGSMKGVPCPSHVSCHWILFHLLFCNWHGWLERSWILVLSVLMSEGNDVCKTNVSRMYDDVFHPVFHLQQFLCHCRW